MTRRGCALFLALSAACGGGRDAWTGVAEAPPHDIGMAAQDESASERPPLEGPRRDLGPDDLACTAPWRCTPHPRWRARSRDEVMAHLGEPFFKSSTEWHYMVKREGCAMPSQRLVFAWPAGRVRFKWTRADLECFPDLELPARDQDTELPALRGADEQAVLRTLGVPHYVEQGQWIYRQPDGCADEREVTKVDWRDGEVVRATSELVHTGEHCEPVSL